MSAGEPPVGDGECIYRRILNRYYNPDLPVPVQPEAFRPTDEDGDGISVFRDSLAAPKDALYGVREEKRNLYHVGRIPVAELKKLGLTVRPDPLPDAPGHAVIPELNTAGYHRDKVAGKKVQLELAKLASTAIVYSPPSPSP